uniref:Uncharacterized protein n=1 Tax=viral metagenome TaxID=1070528 RepID=A0A6H1ZUW9_9ZZZZ
MAGDYKVTLKIVVAVGKDEAEMVNEENFFSDITFSKMVNISDSFYELLAKLKK